MKKAFAIPKLKVSKDHNKENFHSINIDKSVSCSDENTTLGKLNCDLSGKDSTSVADHFKVVPNLQPSKESCPLLRPSKAPPLLKAKPLSGASDDSDEEGTSLTALLAQHASNMSGSEHTSLSALTNFHLKSNPEKSNSDSKPKFVIPSLKLKATLDSSAKKYNFEGHEKLEIPALQLSTSNDNEDEIELCSSGDFVIDLLDALNPPDVRKQLERPQSRGDLDDQESSVIDEQDLKPWLQDRTCILDARPILQGCFAMELKSCSPVGRILCRRRYIRKSPYVRPKSPFISDIVPFAFTTPSPDASVQKYLRRL